MSADTAIRFTDPFAARRPESSPPQHRPYQSFGWPSHGHRHDLNRALTPPRDMNGVATKPYTYAREHAQHYGDYMAAQHPSHGSAAAASYLPQISSTHGRSRGHSRSPEPNARTTAADHTSSRTRKSSQINAIAPSFQIPRSINDSGGSLSELAAQMTCLFWFESSEILQQIEDSPVPLFPPRPLVPDARPTTGFHKWVTTILSTTCVAQNVVLLALLFIHRLKKLNPTVRGKPGSEYRLLTVALMLGNKFLDDNTYTNKTWAEVSGINVAEVHIMEVEFLSNMKYCLFTSAEDWSQWQSLLGRFAAFFDRANRPPPPTPAPILPPASSLHLPMALPSPPPSNQASPPFLADLLANGTLHGNMGPSPAPSPLALHAHASIAPPISRKRSRDEQAVEHPAKRVASEYVSHQTPQPYGSNSTATSQKAPRLTLPSLSIPPSQASTGNYAQPTAAGPQLPPLAVPPRAMAMIYPTSNPSTQFPSLAAVSGAANSRSQTLSQPPPQYQARPIQSHPNSANASPLSALPPTSMPSLHPPTTAQPLSPTHYDLQQRNSPYRPVHHVSTLTHPPTSTSALHQQRPQSLDHDQMSYQPLGKTFQQRQTGRLPYVAQNIWLDPHGAGGAQAMTPVHQWSGFAAPAQHQQSTLQQR